MSSELQVPEDGRFHAEPESRLETIWNALRQMMRKHAPLLIFVFLPTLIVALYLVLIATPQYISEAHFIVRGHSSQSNGISLSSILQSSGGGATSENTYVVQDYMQSRDAAERLIKENHLLDVYSRPEADFVARYPFFMMPRNFEFFYTYYQRHVLVEQDSETNISILTVRTFRAEDSQKIARALLDAGENLVNQINQRQRENLIRATAREVTEAEDKLRQISQKIAEYRNAVALIDPMRQSAPLLGSVSALKNMLTSTNMQLLQLRQSAPDSPLIAAYQRQANILAEQIKLANSQLTGSGDTLVPKITGYEDLVFQETMQQRILASAVASLEMAKVQADREMIYVDEVDQPNLADWPAYPRNIFVLLIVFFSCLGLYIMGSLLIAGAREHSMQ